MDIAHGVSLFIVPSLHSIRKGIVMPTSPGYLYNQVEVLPSGDSGRVGGCGCHHPHPSVFGFAVISTSICAPQSYRGGKSAASIHVRDTGTWITRYPPWSMLKVQSDASEPKSSTTSAGLQLRLRSHGIVERDWSSGFTHT